MTVLHLVTVAPLVTLFADTYVAIDTEEDP